jgi:hypothetical protein
LRSAPTTTPTSRTSALSGTVAQKPHLTPLRGASLVWTPCLSMLASMTHLSATIRRISFTKTNSLSPVQPAACRPSPPPSSQPTRAYHTLCVPELPSSQRRYSRLQLIGAALITGGVMVAAAPPALWPAMGAALASAAALAAPHGGAAAAAAATPGGGAGAAAMAAIAPTGPGQPLLLPSEPLSPLYVGLGVLCFAFPALASIIKARERRRCLVRGWRPRSAGTHLVVHTWTAELTSCPYSQQSSCVDPGLFLVLGTTVEVLTFGCPGNVCDPCGLRRI